MAVSSVSGTGSTTTGSTVSSNQQIASNFQSFLLLLTTQLKNQNPLEPLNTNEFTQQLVQFASVEQQLKTNDTLGALLSSTQASNLSNAVSFVGKTVTADGSTTALANGAATWQVKLPRAARTATMTVTDAGGNVMWTEQKALAAGASAYTWNGRTSSGSLAPTGNYKLTVAATDASGSQVTPSIELSGVVDGVKILNGATVLQVGDYTIPIDKVTSIVR